MEKIDVEKIDRVNSFSEGDEFFSRKALKSPRSCYLYKVMHFAKAEKLFYCLVIDNNNKEDAKSVTNDMEEIYNDLINKYENGEGEELVGIVYRDSMGTWDLWLPNQGFKSLSLHGEPTRNMDTAMAHGKYIMRREM